MSTAKERLGFFGKGNKFSNGGTCIFSNMQSGPRFVNRIRQILICLITLLTQGPNNLI